MKIHQRIDMKIVSIGGVPAGHYFALLMKKSGPHHNITSVERNKPYDTFDWGVVFPDQTLENMRQWDIDTTDEVQQAFNHPSDFKRTVIGERSAAIMTSNQDGRTHMVGNVHAHRSMAFRREHQGSRKYQVCPDHQWSYALKSKLKSVSNARRVRQDGQINGGIMPVDLDPKDYGLVLHWKLMQENIKVPYQYGLPHTWFVTFGVWRADKQSDLRIDEKHHDAGMIFRQLTKSEFNGNSQPDAHSAFNSVWMHFGFEDTTLKMTERRLGQVNLYDGVVEHHRIKCPLH
jgi:phenylpropionate dioxygenase-like ring-hydroxylating dioxygenase large terminal subunit